jgi:hypothetical protein
MSLGEKAMACLRIAARPIGSTERDEAVASAAGDDPDRANIESGPIDIADDANINDADFIASARTDVPALIAEVRRLRHAMAIMVIQACPVCAAKEVADGVLRGGELSPELREILDMKP